MSESAAHHDNPHLQHHFDTPQQQFDSGKLGMWLFLATEILLFGGLFCAYAVYRGNHPEIFDYAHVFLDSKLGAINTVILLCSSLTMAWGVRAAQLGQTKLLRILLALTLAGGLGFMCIKYVEYKAKWEHGLLWGTNYQSQSHHGDDGSHAEEAPVAADEAQAADPATAGVKAVTSAGVKIEQSMLAPPAAGPRGMARPEPEESHAPAGDHAPEGDEPKNVQIFFGIYFLMTGLHGAHVLIGMALIAWVLAKARIFGPAYFTPVDLVGLYWHLVDLIWIFLFPLLYLIK